MSASHCDIPLPEVQSTCPYCGVGCGVSVQPVQSHRKNSWQVRGSDHHPANLGRLCVKGSALGETLGTKNRLLFPETQTQNQRERLGWDQALNTIADNFRTTIAKYGPDSVAFYVSGQLLTEDYYIVNKLVKGFIGTANIDTNSRLCMSSAVAAHLRAFGEDIVPGCYEDLELAEMVVLVGSNMAWCHPVLYRRLAEAKEKNPGLYIVVIDPRRTSSCDLADLHLQLLGGQDVALFNGLLHWLHSHGYQNNPFVEHCTDGLEATLVEAENFSNIENLSRLCGLLPQVLIQFFQKFAQTDKTVTLFSMGVNQSHQGTDTANSIINCHLYTGRIGKPGAGPFSLTGQPNAMGGREVGGLANMLAAHLSLDNSDHRDKLQRFWNSPVMAHRPGLKAVELFEAVESGKIRALWIMATNPVVSLPNADQIRRALSRCEFVVTSDIYAHTDTTAYADLLLPALGWGEKNGTVTNSERCITRQRAFLPMPGEARPDWWAVAEVAKRLGFATSFTYENAAQIFDEHARLSAFENDGERLFNLRGMTGLTHEEYDELAPARWPVLERGQSTDRLFTTGHFSHSHGKACFVAVKLQPPPYQPDEKFPWILNTGRIRDQWHTMSRTGLAPTLSSHLPEPFVDMHPQDALLSGIQHDSLVRLSSAWGSLVVRARCSDSMRRGQLFVPIHWNDQNASDARVGALVNPLVDPVSGEPAFKQTPVHAEPFYVDWHGVVFSRSALNLKKVAWWCQVQTPEALRYELGGRKSVIHSTDGIDQIIGGASTYDISGDWLEYSDQSSGMYHAVYVHHGRLEFCLYIAPRDRLPDRNWLSDLFQKPRLGSRDRMALLAGNPLGEGVDSGPLVCSCFRVGRKTILNTIREQRLSTPQEVTGCLKAGGNCGSCVPEIRQLIAAVHRELEFEKDDS